MYAYCVPYVRKPVGRAAPTPPAPLPKPTRHATLQESLYRMFEEQTGVDISFVFYPPEGGSEVISAHRFMLSARSAVFRAMFCGPLATTEDTIHIPDANLDCFLELLRFLYKDEADITEKSVLGIMYLSDKYMIGALTDLCTSFLASQIEEDNVCMMLELAKIYSAEGLQATCLEFITYKTSFVLKSDGFLDVHQSTLLQILQLDVLNAREDELLEGALAWAENECHRKQLEPSPSNQRHVLGDVFYALRLPCLCKEQLDELVTERGILTDEEVSMIQDYQNAQINTDGKLSKTTENEASVVKIPFSTNKRLRSLSDSSYCELLKSTTRSVVFSNKMNVLDCIAPDDLRLYCVEVLDLSTTSHTVKVTVNIIQGQKTLCQYGVKIAASRAVNHLGCIVPVNFPNPPLITRGAFQIGVTYRFVGGAYGTVPSGTPYSTDIECGGISLSFPDNKSCHIAGLELGWV